MNNQLSEIGVIGLGVMGSALSLNLADQGFHVAVYNRNEGSEEGVVDEFLSKNSKFHSLQGFTHLSEFIDSLERPRKIIIMISAAAVDTVIEQILPFLAAEDIILETGNSHYKDTKRRQLTCTESGIQFFGIGVSGGEKGARFGPSIMPGGNKSAYNHIEKYLKEVAALDKNGQACVSFIGTDGAGHFVKMVHNGIEYVEMQLLAEVYQLLRNNKSNEEISELLEEWNKGAEQSYLIEITSKILTKKEDDNYLLDLILDKAGNKGTGSWSTIAALELGTENSMMSSAVFARYISSFKRLRTFLNSEKPSESLSIDLNHLKDGYQCARILNHLQGFELIRTASEEYDWGINYSELARIWTNGCIIRSTLMEVLSDLFLKCDSLLTNTPFVSSIKEHEVAMTSVLHNAIENRIAVPAFSSAWNYWVGLTTEQGPSNLIQAQRDFFGAHTYQRNDDSSGTSHHTNWEE